MNPELRELARILLACEKVKGGCWVYQKSVTTKGYAQTKIKRGHAHRFVYEMLTESYITDDWDVHHLCGEKRCMNPRHMEEIPHVVHAHLHNPRGRGTMTHCGTCGEEKTVARVERGREIMRCYTCTRATQRRADAKRRVRS